MSEPTGGTYTWTAGNGVSDPVPYNASAEVSHAALMQAFARNTRIPAPSRWTRLKRWLGFGPKGMRFPNGIPRVPSDVDRASALLGDFQRGHIEYDEFLDRIEDIYPNGREHG